MPTLPHQPGGSQQSPQNNGVSKKGLVIFAVIAIVIVLIIVFRSLTGSDQSDTSIPESEPETTSYITEASSEPEVVEPPDPSENDGTSIPVLDGVIFKGTDGYIFASDVGFSETKTIADITSIVMDDNVSIKPVASCIYYSAANSVSITHTSGSVLSVYRAYLKSSEDESSGDLYDTQLQQHARANGFTNTSIGDVFINTSRCGRYIRGTVTPANASEPMTCILCYFNFDKYIYTCTALFNSQDTCDMLFGSLTCNRGKIQFS